MTYTELGDMDAMIVDRLYMSHVVRRELDLARLEEREQKMALIANGQVEHLDREIRKIANEGAQRREQIIAMADGAFEDEAEQEFTNENWWEKKGGAGAA